MTTKKKSRSGGRDRFAKDVKVPGEYENPGPSVDKDANAIAGALSQLSGREKTGFVTKWLPPWAKRAKVGSFSFFFFEDRLAVDFFNRDREEMDALADDLTQAQRQDISAKTVLCGAQKIAYLVLGPDDELDLTQIAAKIGKTTFKKGGKMLSRAGAAGVATGDGIEEEGD